MMAQARNPSTLGGWKWVDRLSPGAQDQHGQHSLYSSLGDRIRPHLKIKLAAEPGNGCKSLTQSCSLNRDSKLLPTQPPSEAVNKIGKVLAFMAPLHPSVRRQTAASRRILNDDKHYEGKSGKAPIGRDSKRNMKKLCNGGAVWPNLDKC
ncbi:hypothetical protein AAY473_027080 [Plecturocebus cupreus]